MTKACWSACMVRLLGWQGECQTKKNRGLRVESCGLVRDKRIAYHATKALKRQNTERAYMYIQANKVPRRGTNPGHQNKENGNSTICSLGGKQTQRHLKLHTDVLNLFLFLPFPFIAYTSYRESFRRRLKGRNRFLIN
jgi:hypothetical protein